MSLKNTEFTNSNRKCNNQAHGSNDNNILFPKRPNKRYQIFISKEKQKYDLNWENKLKDQNLTDQNFFLNYYSYEKNRENAKFPSNRSIKFENEPYSLSNNRLNINTPSKNVHLIRNRRANYKNEVDSNTKANDEIKIFESESISSSQSNLSNEVDSINNSNSQDLNDNFDDILINESDNIKADKKFDTLKRSPDVKTNFFSTPSKKKARSTFSKSLNLPLPSKESFNDFDHFINFDNITQFAQFPKRFSRTRQEERKKFERKNFSQSQQIISSLPEISIPSRKEVLSLKPKTPKKMITSNSVQSEKFPTINKCIKLPCTVLSATATRFDLQ